MLLVVQGGPGTLASILKARCPPSPPPPTSRLCPLPTSPRLHPRKAIEGECPVVLVRDSGGVAMLLDHFLLTYKDQGSLFYKKGEILPQFEKAFGPKREMLTKIAELDMHENKVSSFALTETATAELDLHLLNAVIYDVNQVRPELRLRLAVEWNRKDVVERVLRMSEEKSDMRGALQCAVATAP